LHGKQALTLAAQSSVRQTEEGMRRLGIAAVHLLALPGTLLAAALISLGEIVLFPTAVSQRNIDIQMHDTYFVVAHVHVSALVCAWVAVTTLVAFRQGTLSWFFGAGWISLILHLTAAALPWPALTDPGTRGEAVAFVRFAPLHLDFARLYLASAVLAFLASLTGLLLSLARGLQSRQAESV
jgi:hypothetical protein